MESYTSNNNDNKLIIPNLIILADTESKIDFNRKYTKKELMDMHCRSFCDFNMQVNKEVCNRECLCFTDKFSSNQIEKPICK